MKLIAALGNPGKKYEYTRHNVGFLVLDAWRKEQKFFVPKEKKRFLGLVSTGVFHEKEVMLFFPQTFMNDSGKAIKKIVSFSKIRMEDILVIHDELDLLLGKFRLSYGSRSAGHNGVESIVQELGTRDFARLRIGINSSEPDFHDFRRRDPAGFVLHSFSSSELEVLGSFSSNFFQEIEEFIIGK